jgi:uncharacterized protein YeeX (DUF496 family)
MRRMIVTTGVALALINQPSPSAAQPPATDDGANAQLPAADNAAVPVKGVVLFSSGVGYFEHFGTVRGDGASELRFKAGQINDILKSLVLQDLDGGKVLAVTYPSQDPVAKTLRSFQVDITANPPLGELLNQLRGAEVTLVMSDTKVAGTVLGVETKKRPYGRGDDDNKVVEVPIVNLITETGIRAIDVEGVLEVQIADPKLRDELNQALAALAAARDQDKKPVQITFQGQGERRIRIGYVVETPVWKTSYRLVLGDVNADKPQAAGSAALQGWAIIENQTDNDWDNIQLSLVSGRPISFVQDLYQPLYIPRPVVTPELYASLRPQVYGAGEGNAALRKVAARQAMEASKSAEEAEGKMELGYRGPALNAPTPQPMDVTSSVAALASAAQVGELFQYTVPNVSLARQRSAMIPIVTDPVEIERVSIYTPGVLPRNPLNGVRVKNTTGKHLLAGPVTVLDAGSYAGDARIDNVPPGQERMLSYGVDLQMLVNADARKQENWLRTAKIVDGVLQVSRKVVAEQRYDVDNKAAVDRVLIVEHPRRSNWELEETPVPAESTDAVYRFRVPVAAGRQASLTVKQGTMEVQAMQIGGLNPQALAYYVAAREIPETVRAALAKAADLQRAIADTQRKLKENEARLATITTEQARIRENMRTVDRNGAYYNRLSAKLNDQESKIETLQTEQEELRKTLENQNKALADYLGTLSVG